MRAIRPIGYLGLLWLSWIGILVGSTTADNQMPAKRIFWADSYNSGYAWSDGIERGIRNLLNNKDIELGVFHMDTKKCKTQACMRASAQRARAAIEAFQPDVLIASDDNAQKYLVVPYYKDGPVPVVFCGVNWDASTYGYPSPNVTGMIEVDLAKETVAHMRRHAAGDRIGYISGDTTSDRKIIAWLNQHFFDMQMKAVRVKNFEMFKKRFIELQNQVDMLFIRNYAGIDGWDALAAKNFIAKNLTVPTGTNNDFMAPYVIFTLGKLPEEQGSYAADTAIKIIKGTKPGDLPVTANRRARLTVNLEMARAAKITLPLSVLKVATVIGREKYQQPRSGSLPTLDKIKGKRIVWVDSYHQGYEWSDGIERGIKEILYDTGTELKIIRMNTKRDNTEPLIKAAAKRAKARLEAFGPDIVIASDDNAQKYLVVPFYRDTDLPVVFCGVNWDASMYGYPAANVTGMVEITPVKELIALLKPYARGDRIGYLAGNVATERKLVAIYNEQLFDGKMRSYLVSTRADFEKRFLQAQQEVDILYFSNYTGITDWDAAAAEQFVLRHTRIPTGSDNAFMQHYVVCTLAKFPEEQGRYAALTALKILDGQSPGSIPLDTNKENALSVNLQLAKKAGIVFPLSILKQARVIGRKNLD